MIKYLYIILYSLIRIFNNLDYLTTLIELSTPGADKCENNKIKHPEKGKLKDNTNDYTTKLKFWDTQINLDETQINVCTKKIYVWAT